MKKAKEFLDEIKNGVSGKDFVISEHPAKQLDEYMKEQYFIILFGALKDSETDMTEALSYILQIAECAGYEYNPEMIVKRIYNMNEDYDDYINSFIFEEIKYLLGFELYIINQKLNETSSYIAQLSERLEIPDTEQDKYKQIYNVIRNDDLDCYEEKECYLHSSILSCYLKAVDFSGERYIGESNAYPDFPVSENYVVKKFGDELKRISYFDTIVTSEMLDNISTRFYGIQVRKCSAEEEQKYRYDEYALKSQKAEGNHYQECDIDIGAIFIFYNRKNSFDAPVLVHTHPLDMIEEVEKYVESEFNGV
ncbi:MAG: hypothetical protein NC548_48760 [Lachnospiraceae bacterium]|nr:hypothetical protein [Lachnospiraceae bacterium]